VLVCYDRVPEPVAYNMIKAMHVYHDDYKASAPGATGWAMSRQKLSKFVPYHPGAVRYYKEIGAWPASQDAVQAASLARQKVLIDSWAAFIKGAPSDRDAFQAGWIKARGAALKTAGMAVVFDSW
jgi:hypothetical protein